MSRYWLIEMKKVKLNVLWIAGIAGIIIGIALNNPGMAGLSSAIISCSSLLVLSAFILSIIDIVLGVASKFASKKNAYGGVEKKDASMWKATTVVLTVYVIFCTLLIGVSVFGGVSDDSGANVEEQEADTAKAEQETSEEHVFTTKEIIEPSCSDGGYTIEECEICGTIKTTGVKAAKGHSFTEKTRTEATYDKRGEVVSVCKTCGEEKIEYTAMLKLPSVDFNGMDIKFGKYLFDTFNNAFSEHNGEAVIKFPVTVKNTSNATNSLMFNCKVFDPSGVECDDISYYYDDDIRLAGELMPGASYTKHFYVPYSRDGTYTFYFTWLLENKTAEIIVSKDE